MIPPKIPPNLRHISAFIQTSKKILDSKQQAVNNLSNKIPRNLNQKSQSPHKYKYRIGQQYKNSNIRDIEKKHLLPSDATITSDQETYQFSGSLKDLIDHQDFFKSLSTLENNIPEYQEPTNSMRDFYQSIEEIKAVRNFMAQADEAIINQDHEKLFLILMHCSDKNNPIHQEIKNSIMSFYEKIEGGSEEKTKTEGEDHNKRNERKENTSGTGKAFKYFSELLTNIFVSHFIIKPICELLRIDSSLTMADISTFFEDIAKQISENFELLDEANKKLIENVNECKRQAIASIQSNPNINPRTKEDTIKKFEEQFNDLIASIRTRTNDASEAAKMAKEQLPPLSKKSDLDKTLEKFNEKTKKTLSSTIFEEKLQSPLEKKIISAAKNTADLIDKAFKRDEATILSLYHRLSSVKPNKSLSEKVSGHLQGGAVLALTIVYDHFKGKTIKKINSFIPGETATKTINKIMNLTATETVKGIGGKSIDQVASHKNYVRTTKNNKEVLLNSEIIMKAKEQAIWNYSNFYVEVYEGSASATKGVQNRVNEVLKNFSCKETPTIEYRSEEAKQLYKLLTPSPKKKVTSPVQNEFLPKKDSVKRKFQNINFATPKKSYKKEYPNMEFNPLKAKLIIPLNIIKQDIKSTIEEIEQENEEINKKPVINEQSDPLPKE